MAASSVQDPEYKEILVINETIDLMVHFSVYLKSDPICLWPSKKQLIWPASQYFHRDKGAFKYKIEIEKNGEHKTIVPTQKWKENKLISVKFETEDKLPVNQKALSKCPNERQIAVRRKNMEEDTTCKHGRDLYAILRLNAKEVRKKSEKEQEEIINKACQEEMLIFHPDRNPDLGDSQIWAAIRTAYWILSDSAKRVLYHDLTDYSGGWMSKSRWKAIFQPEAHEDDEKSKRIGFLVLSAIFIVGGIAFAITASFSCGLLLPVEAAICGGVADALIGGGLNAAGAVLSADTIRYGLNFEKYALRFAVGALVAVVGGVLLEVAGIQIGIEFGLDVIRGDAILDVSKIQELIAYADVKGLQFAVSKAFDKYFEGNSKSTVLGSGIGIGNFKLDSTKRSVIRYTCNEPYFTRMIVDYLDGNGRETQEIVEGSGSTVELPEHATKIEVKFQNQRFIGTWCDVKKYNRIEKRWIKPTDAHVFNFHKPVTLTFTLEGSLYYVAVMKVRDQFYQDLDIME